MRSHYKWTALPAAAITALILAADVTGQVLASRAPPDHPAPPANRVVLRPSYQLQLESAWPAPPGETDACNNRASETLAGSLRRVGANRYEGRFTRRTRLGFCGTHGAAVQRCGAVLRGEGQVGVVGVISAGAAGRPTMSLVWQPIPGTTRIRMDGSCAPRFIAALEGMYRDAVHSVDFSVPVEEHEKAILEDYGRTLEIR
jgi:hypothetical protein